MKVLVVYLDWRNIDSFKSVLVIRAVCLFRTKLAWFARLTVYKCVLY